MCVSLFPFFFFLFLFLDPLNDKFVLFKDKKDLHCAALPSFPPHWLLPPSSPLPRIPAWKSAVLKWSEDGLCHGKFGHLHGTVMMVAEGWFPFGVESRGWRGWGGNGNLRLGQSWVEPSGPTKHPHTHLLQQKERGDLNLFPFFLSKKDKKYESRAY